MFTAGAFETLYGSRFTITPQSNRMGYRLEGSRLVHSGSADILSDATAIGSLQVPASGQPIMLMADRQTTGGYPKIATVITADLPIAGQLAPGDWIEFAGCTRASALDALATPASERLDGSVSDDLDARLRSTVASERVHRDAPLAPLTTFKVGGPADWLIDVALRAETMHVVSRDGRAGLPVRPLGGGSNVLVADQGYAASSCGCAGER